MDAPVFEIHLEDTYDAFHNEKGTHSSIPAFSYLLSILAKNNITADIYKMDHIEFESKFHNVKSHGRYHRRWENADRRPYQWLGFTGGFWFRILPLWLLKWNIKREGLFYLHLHDIDEQHPKLKNPIMNLKRHLGLKGARSKLERLLKEVQFRTLP